MDAIHRLPEKASQERQALDSLLDEALYGTLCTVVDGQPWVVPMLYARDGDRILLHGSTGAGALRQVAAGAPSAFSVTLVDGLVVAYSTFESSAHYRSAVLRGVLVPVPGEDGRAALDLMSDRWLPGRVAEVAPMTKKERAASLVLALPITPGQWTLKISAGEPDRPDVETPVWQGVIPMQQGYGEPVRAPWVPAETPIPPSVRNRMAAD
ncbi:MAG: pyridoxamine 5'-phosphate oxidase family protein [Micropruina sp.]|nr:pyridoxamine 5'-phosphate oxidase family protein [Micropruina sp.]